MTKPHLALRIAAAAVLAAGVAVWMIRQFSELSYNGKQLNVWLDEAARNGIGAEIRSGWRDSQPAQAVLAIGPRGLPLLLSLVRAKDTPLRKKLRDFAQIHKWIPIHPRDPDDLHELARYGFWVLGPAAKSAAPQLIAALDDDNAQVRAAAAYALSVIDPADIAALPALEKRLNALSQTNSLSDDLQDEARCVLHAVGEMGPQARSVLPEIMLLSQRQSHLIAWAKAARIKITGEGLDSAIAPLSNPSVVADWGLACDVVTEFGTNAAPAVPLLVANLQCTNHFVPTFALFALAGIHARPDLCLPSITQFLSSSNDWMRAFTLQAISSFGRPATQWVSTSQIAPCLTNELDEARKEATNALRRLFPEAAAKLSAK